MTSCTIHTHGGVFDVLKPNPAQIRIEDIAHALAFQCRFNGHVRFHYSVGQHSLLVAKLVLDQTDDQRLALTALLHDATEAYLPDVISPLKPLLVGFREIEARLSQVIAAKYSLLWPEPAVVKEADLLVLAAEREQVIADTDRSAWRELPVPADIEIKPSRPEMIRTRFLAAFLDYTN